MKNKITIFCAIFFTISIQLIAQNCTPENLLQKPGIWKAGMKDGSTSRSTPVEIARGKKVTDAIHQLISKNYTPKGLEAIFANTKPSTYSQGENKILSYYYGIYFMQYYCNQNLQKTVHETSTTLKVSANYPNIHFTSNVIADYIGEKFEKENYGELPQRPVLENGVWYLGAKEEKNGFGQKLRTKSWIVAYNDIPPFLHVSRKEYLEKMKAKLIIAKGLAAKSFSSAYVRPKAEQEADKKRIIDANSQTESGKRWVRDKFLPEYKTDEQKRDEDVVRSNANYDKRIEYVNNYLKGSEKELAQDAILGVYWDTEGFVKEDYRNKKYVVKENPAYYNKKLPLAVPQLFGIEFIVEYENPIIAQAEKDVMKALDFSALKNMLGK